MSYSIQADCENPIDYSVDSVQSIPNAICSFWFNLYEYLYFCTSWSMFNTKYVTVNLKQFFGIFFLLLSSTNKASKLPLGQLSIVLQCILQAVQLTLPSPMISAAITLRLVYRACTGLESWKSLHTLFFRRGYENLIKIFFLLLTSPVNILLYACVYIIYYTFLYNVYI